MTSELIVDVNSQEISIAITEEKQLVEFQREKQSDTFSVGNIYHGRVKKIMPGLNACFVDVGSEKEAFLHYSDLGPQFYSIQKYLKQVTSDRKKNFPISKASIMPEKKKEGNIAEALQTGQEVLVQIIKEPINTKGPRLTGELSFAGRFMILIPFEDKVSVSTKIKSPEERTRLKQLMQSIKPKNFGIIIRTAAEGKKVAELDNELRSLIEKWASLVEKTQKSTKPPTVVHEESDRTLALLRDLFNPSYESIHVNDIEVYKRIRNYVSVIAPESIDIIKLYRGELPIFDHFGITRQIKSSFGRIVSFKGGAYLVIEHTEALHVVDVNSGNRARNNASNQEENALEVNLGAADELARQLRLRDMGGIIVVDFIDMDKAEHRQAVYERMSENMSRDRAKHNILPLSKFGLMQITRQRVRPATNLEVEENCPVCNGKGKIAPSILFTDTLESKIETLVNATGKKRIKLHLHPYVASYIKQGFISIYRKWQMKYSLGLRVIPDQRLAYLEHHFYDKDGNEVDMKEESEIK